MNRLNVFDISEAKTIMKQHDSHSLFFNITLPDLNAVWMAYTVTLEPAHCFDPIRKGMIQDLGFNMIYCLLKVEKFILQ